MNPSRRRLAASLSLAFLCCLAPAAHARDYLNSDVPRPMALRNIAYGRAFDDNTSGKINPAPRVPKPRIISKAEWGASPTTAPMQSHFPSLLTLHHEATNKPLAADADVPKMLRNLQSWGFTAKQWPDIPYHYMIDINGNVYEARNPLMRGDTNTSYDTTGHLLICFMGNFELQTPNEKQLNAASDFMAWCCDYYNISPETLRGHMEYVESTQCPGKYLYPYLVSGFFEGEIRKRLQAAYAK